MNDAIATISLAGLVKAPARITDNIVVGKDVLELLAGAMYADPLTVYREYVQNAADAIDEARAAELPAVEGPDVSITFDHVERIVRIRDHGIGVSAEDFVTRLSAVGASGKRGTSLRGFRGVGRFSGLGYCQELIFRSRDRAGAAVKELRWNGRVLREKLRDQTFKGNLQDLIREIATVTTAQNASTYPDHFFEVEMRKVLRIKNDLLMNEVEVRRYLGQVAPVPFSPHFKLGVGIRDWLTARGIGMPISVGMSDGLGPVYHRAVDEIVTPKVGTTTFRGVDFLELKNTAGELLAVGWILDHGYTGAIPRSSHVAGVRLRTRDVQVGDELALAPLFSESRFATWAVGDLHVVHPKIIPNGRRDDFEHSAVYGELQDELKALTKSLGQTIRARSNDRLRDRRIRLALMYANGWLEIAHQRSLHPTIKRIAAEQADAQLKIAEKEGTKSSLPEDAEKAVAASRNEVKRLTAYFGKKAGPGRPSIGESKGARAAVSAILSSTTQIKKVIPLAERVLQAMEDTTVKRS